MDKRWETVKRSHLCFNCLGKGHTLPTCPSKRTCRECSVKHHSLLHHPKPPPYEAAVLRARNGHPSEAERSPLSMTALVNVSAGVMQQRARIFLDPGSVVTLISSKLAKSLQAKLINSPITISGMFAGTTVKHRVNVTLSSIHPGMNTVHKVSAYVVDCIPAETPKRDVRKVQDKLRNKLLADPDFGGAGRMDILLGVVDCNHIDLDRRESSDNRKIKAASTIFGWTLSGELSSDATKTQSSCLKIASRDQPCEELLERFWAVESVPGEGSAPPEEQQAMDHFRDTVVRDEDGRYSVQLPRKSPAPQLGDSRKIAEKRFLQNERALMRKGTWDAFNAAVKEYPDLGHAEEVPTADRSKPPGECYYLPMHGVVKNSPTTTKLRVVFDASAHSESGASLNDQLLSGPSLYPHLTKVVNRFRTHSISMSSDVSKMFREVGLQPSERDFHRFLIPP